jgi:hypothetical protein
MELHHIKPKANGGTDDIENAIPLCLECHAEVEHYNVNHPKGRKFQPGELLLHKKQWLALCESNPGAIVEAPRIAESGPLHSLIDELAFNKTIAEKSQAIHLGCPFEVKQFDRAMSVGVFPFIDSEIKNALYICYRLMKRANESLKRFVHAEREASASNNAAAHVRECIKPIADAQKLLQDLLQADKDDSQADDVSP